MSLFLVIIAMNRFPQRAAADEIYLKDGRRIVTDRVRKEKGFVRYRIPGGELGIREEKVDRIVVSQEPAGHPSSHSLLDLSAGLHRKLNPRNAIEEAVIATVSVITPAATGSGFFITERGHIITNRHVVRVNRQLLEQAEKTFRDGKSTMDRLKRRIRALKREIARDERFLSETNRKISMMDEETRFPSRTKALQHQRQRTDLVNAYNARLPKYYDRQTKYKLMTRQLQVQQPEMDRLQTEYDQMQERAVAVNRVEVILADGQKHRARLVALSRTYDVALLKLEGFRTPFIPRSNQENIVSATPVYAIGNPTGVLPNSVSSGSFQEFVSGGVLSGHRGVFLQVDAKIYPGNSGGPLVNEEGRVLGINTLKEVTRKFEGLGYALAIRIAFEEFKRHLPGTEL